MQIMVKMCIGLVRLSTQMARGNNKRSVLPMSSTIGRMKNNIIRTVLIPVAAVAAVVTIRKLFGKTVPRWGVVKRFVRINRRFGCAITVLRVIMLDKDRIRRLEGAVEAGFFRDNNGQFLKDWPSLSSYIKSKQDFNYKL